jgi:hypothetical protein
LTLLLIWVPADGEKAGNSRNASRLDAVSEQEIRESKILHLVAGSDMSFAETTMGCVG